MASMRLASRSGRQLLQSTTRQAIAPARSSFRSLNTSTRVSARSLPKTIAYHNATKNLRQFSISATRKIESQEAPNSQNYLNSGAIAGARDLVDVKKVLVIGSGGLAIGQAGEFDYSGECGLHRNSVPYGGILSEA